MTAADKLDIKTTRRADEIVVSLEGSASMEHCDRLSQALIEVCQEKPRTLIVDLSRLKFICSLALGGFVVAYLRLQKQGGKLVLAAPSKAILDVLTTTKLASLMPIQDAVQAPTR